MTKRWLKLAVVPVAFAFVAAACGTSDDDDAAEDTGATSGGTEAETATTTAGTSAGTGTATTTGGTGTGTTSPYITAPPGSTPSAGSIVVDPALAGTEVTVFGPESSAEEAGAHQDALNAFGEANGMTITYVGARDFEEQINSQVTGGNPPDIAIFPQPGKLRDFAASEDVFPLPDDVLATAQANWDENWLAFWQDAEGTQYGVPNKSDLKSLVWYSPAAFEEKGYTVPETFDDFVALTDEMIANGDTPLCVGIESGPATGWPFTDWTEELILRNEGLDYYNGWVAHDTPFNDPPVVEAMTTVNDLWQTEGAVYAAGGSIAATPFGDNAQALVDGNCMMHRQANFFASFFPADTAFGDGPGAIDVFYFPSTSEEKPVLVAGTSAAAFRDAPEVWAVMNYYAGPAYADNRQVAQLARKGAAPGGDVVSGYISANQNANQENYNALEQGFLEVLATGSPAGFDGSDQMPGEVGSGTFWREATALVNGDTDAQAAADAIEDSWPS
jgi:alpha-glucoside transport system substrate-binding protein